MWFDVPLGSNSQVKGQHHDYLVEDMARAEEREEVIDVVHAMIEQRSELFKVRTSRVHCQHWLTVAAYSQPSVVCCCFVVVVVFIRVEERA